MKFQLPQIFWHGNRERIMSVDFGPDLQLISAGTDLYSSVYLRLWQVRLSPELKVDHIEDLAGTHERGVNIVRYSPCHSFIASGSDDACVLTWEKKKKPVFGEDSYVLGWGAKKVLRGHSREVHDLAWSPNSKFLASGSLDGSVIVFNVETGRVLNRFEGSKPIHGVAWCGKFIVSMSTDRCLRMYEQGKKGFYIRSCIKEYENAKLFQDEASSSAFFRKLEFSPDGLFLVTTAGCISGTPCIHLFLYEHFNYPSLSFPVTVTEKPTALAIRFCPVVFKLTKESIFQGVRVKTVWAVACKDSVILFNSEMDKPFAAISNPHYSSITDLAWYQDLALAISSTDGYVSFVLFKEGELGERTVIEERDSSKDMEIDIEKNDLVNIDDEVNMKIDEKQELNNASEFIQSSLNININETLNNPYIIGSESLNLPTALKSDQVQEIDGSGEANKKRRIIPVLVAADGSKLEAEVKKEVHGNNFGN